MLGVGFDSMAFEASKGIGVGAKVSSNGVMATSFDSIASKGTSNGASGTFPSYVALK